MGFSVQSRAKTQDLTLAPARMRRSVGTPQQTSGNHISHV